MGDELTRPIIGIENRTAQEVFDIMSDRIRRARAQGPGEAVADGWVMVPIEPTPEMKSAAWDAYSPIVQSKIGVTAMMAKVYRAMIAATPTREAGNKGSSQGCGTGHSADAGTLPALASSLRNGLEAMACYATVPMSLWDRFSNNVLKAADALDGGEAVHSPAEREGSRDKPRTEYVAVTEAVRLAEKQMTSLREALAAHPQKGGEG